MSSPSQMFTHRLNPLKSWPNPYALDKALDVADGETIVAGMIMHIDPTTSKFKVGLGSANNVPIFALNGTTHWDTSEGADDGNLSAQGRMKGLSGLVALGGYEVQTTEFQSGQTYNPNTPLTEGTGANAGKVTPGEFYTDTIVGIVSDGKLGTTNAMNAHAVECVQFWTYFLPSSN